MGEFKHLVGTELRDISAQVLHCRDKAPYWMDPEPRDVEGRYREPFGLPCKMLNAFRKGEKQVRYNVISGYSPPA